MKGECDLVAKTTCLFVLVLYGDYGGLHRLLINQTRSEVEGAADYKILIVDNTEHERRVEIPDNVLHGASATVLLPEKNLGYSGAAQWALSLFPDGWDYVIVANTDLEFDASAVTSRLAELSLSGASRGVAMVAPRLVKEDGGTSRQIHYLRRPSGVKYIGLAVVFSVYKLALLYRKYAERAKSRDLTAIVETSGSFVFAPHGAMIICTKEFIDKAGEPFDIPSFLFCEEAFLGLAAQEIGLSSIFLDSITYSHRRHGAMGDRPDRQVIRYLRDAHWLCGWRILRTSRTGHR